jgi:putative transcriptional regulator
MEAVTSYTNHFLIAMPGMADPNFSSSVTLICEHNQNGAMGIVINRPSEHSLADLFAQLSIDDYDDKIGEQPIMHGGPVTPERGFVLHKAAGAWESSMTLSEDLQVTLSRDILEEIAAGRGPQRFLVALGYAGWEQGQLEEEVLANSWLTVPASAEIVFDAPFSQRWTLAARQLGFDISHLSSDAGHA